MVVLAACVMAPSVLLASKVPLAVMLPNSKPPVASTKVMSAPVALTVPPKSLLPSSMMFAAAVTGLPWASSCTKLASKEASPSMAMVVLAAWVISPSVLTTLKSPLTCTSPRVRPSSPSATATSSQLPPLVPTNETTPSKALSSLLTAAFCRVPVWAVKVAVPAT